MSPCHFEKVEFIPERNKWLHSCKVCQFEMCSRHEDSSRVRGQCQVGSKSEREHYLMSKLDDEARVQVAQQAEASGILLGDMIAEMTKAVGVPPCGGCEKRREWLNRLHAWLRGPSP